MGILWAHTGAIGCIVLICAPGNYSFGDSHNIIISGMTVSTEALMSLLMSDS